MNGEDTADLDILSEAKNKLLDLCTTAEDHPNGGNAPDFTMKAGIFI